MLRVNPYQFYTEMRQNKDKALLADLGLTMHGCSCTEMNNERELGDVSRMVGSDRVSLSNASIMSLLLFYIKKNNGMR
jgi:hypothetical protein